MGKPIFEHAAANVGSQKHEKNHVEFEGIRLVGRANRHRDKNRVGKC